MIVIIFVTIGLFLLLRNLLGFLPALIISVVFDFCWFSFNYYSNRAGLIKAIWRRYYVSLQVGLSHEQAIERVIISRGLFNKLKIPAIQSEFERRRVKKDQTYSPFDDIIAYASQTSNHFSDIPELNDLILLCYIIYEFETQDHMHEAFNYKAIARLSENYKNSFETSNIKNPLPEKQPNQIFDYGINVQKIKENPHLQIYRACRIAFRKRADYSAYSIISKLDVLSVESYNTVLFKLVKFYQSNEISNCVEIIDSILDYNYFDFWAHFFSHHINKKIATDKADYHRIVFLELLKSIVSSNDGKSQDSAFEVIAVSEIYAILHHLKEPVIEYDFKNLIHDRFLTIKSTKDQFSNDQNIYFNCLFK